MIIAEKGYKYLATRLQTYGERIDSATERLALFILQIVIAGNGISVIGEDELEKETIIGLRSHVI